MVDAGNYFQASANRSYSIGLGLRDFNSWDGKLAGKGNYAGKWDRARLGSLKVKSSVRGPGNVLVAQEIGQVSFTDINDTGEFGLATDVLTGSFKGVSRNGTKFNDTTLDDLINDFANYDDYFNYESMDI